MPNEHYLTDELFSDEESREGLYTAFLESRTCVGMPFYQRKYEFTEHDDFVRHVQPYLEEHQEAIPQYHEGVVVGWKIQGVRE